VLLCTSSSFIHPACLDVLLLLPTNGIPLLLLHMLFLQPGVVVLLVTANSSSC
jgi:hypothetical protein